MKLFVVGVFGDFYSMGERESEAREREKTTNKRRTSEKPLPY